MLILVENLSVPADRRVWQEAQALTRAGIDVVVACPVGTERDRASFARIEGIEIHRFRPRPANGGAVGYALEYGTALHALRGLVRRLGREQAFDVVHACNPPDLLFLAALSQRRRGAALVFDHHDLVPELFRSRFARRGPLYAATLAAERLTYRLADVVLATNESYRSVAVTRGRKAPDEVFVVRNAPQLEESDAVRGDPSLRQGRTHLLAYAGIMGPQDGVDHALRALAALRRRRSDWRAVLVGDGDVLGEMRALSNDLGLADDVEFTGWLEPEAMRRVIASADVCIAPDPRSPLNDVSTMVKVLEYMALGRPTVSYDLPESRVSAGEAAEYVTTDRPEALAEAIDGLLDDPVRRERMGIEGRARVEGELSWVHSERALLAAYDRAFAIRDERR